jgi:hypothetical protein
VLALLVRLAERGNYNKDPQRHTKFQAEISLPNSDCTLPQHNVNLLA